MINFTTILNDLMGAAIVVAALIAVGAIIKLIASVVGKSKPEAEEENSEPAAAAPVNTKHELKLIDVDEKTAAIIMAIVSHESGIPLSELEFSSIKLV